MQTGIGNWWCICVKHWVKHGQQYHFGYHAGWQWEHFLTVLQLTKFLFPITMVILICERIKCFFLQTGTIRGVDQLQNIPFIPLIQTEHWTPQKIAWDPLLRIRLPQDPLTYSLYTPNSNEDTQVVIYILETSVHNVSTTISLNDNQCQLYSYIIFYSIMLFGICSIQV